MAKTKSQRPKKKKPPAPEPVAEPEVQPETPPTPPLVFEWQERKDFNLIPRHFLEQIEERDPMQSPERIYRMAPALAADPLTYLYFTVNDRHLVSGFLWGTIDPFLEVLWINGLAFDKDVTAVAGNGMARTSVVSQCTDFLKKNFLYDENTPMKIMTIVMRDKSFEHLGWTEHSRKIMEI